MATFVGIDKSSLEKPDPAPEPETDEDPAPAPKPEAKPKPDPDPEPVRRAKTEPDPDPDPEPVRRATTEPDPDPEPQPVRRATTEPSDGESKDDFYYLPPVKPFQRDPSRPDRFNADYDDGIRMCVLNTRRETMIEIIHDLDQYRDSTLRYYPKDGKSPAYFDSIMEEWEAYTYVEVRETFKEMAISGFRISEFPPHLGQAWFVWYLFKIFDQDRDGYLSYREMHELLTISSTNFMKLMHSNYKGIRKWAKSQFASRGDSKTGGRETVISKHYWEKIAADFGVPPMPGLPVEAVAALYGPENVCTAVTILNATSGNGYFEASPKHDPAKDEQNAQTVSFSIEQWNSMYPDHAIDAEAQRMEAEVDPYPEPPAYDGDY